jgi:Xaa-Pro aminopeptidase
MDAMFKGVITDRQFVEGDVFCKGSSGITYLGQGADIDRTWHIGSEPASEVRKWYRVTRECLESMAEAMRPGVACSKVFAVENRVAKKNGLPERLVGRNGHWSNQSGISIHSGRHPILELGMVMSC